MGKLFIRYQITKQSIVFLFALTFILILAGCTRVTTHINEIDVISPMPKLPINITQDKKVGDLEIKPSVSYYKNDLIKSNTGTHMNVNREGIYEVEYIEEDNDQFYLEHDGNNSYEFDDINLRWNIPDWNAALYLDYCMAKHIGLFIGMNYSKIKDEVYWDNYYALSFFNEIETQAWRIDLGLRYYNSKYDVEYIKRQEYPRYSDDALKVYIHSNTELISFNSSYITFTLNSKKTNQKINFFFSSGLSQQNLFSFNSEKPDSDLLSKRSSHFSLSVGLYSNIYKHHRVLAGIKVNQQSNLGETQRKYLVEYFMQFDINAVKLFKD